MFVLFNAIDHLCAALPVAVRLGLYGLIVGVLAMLIYWLLAPQGRILAIRAEMADAQRALRAYNGTDPRQILSLSAKSISPAVKQLLVLLLPTLVATAPVLLVMDWLESTYAHRLPTAGDSIMMTISGPVAGSEPIRSVPRGAIGQPLPGGRYAIAWPAIDQNIPILDVQTDQELLRLPLRQPLTTIGRRHWWSALVEGPDRIELPPGTSVSSIEFDLAPLQVLSLGPGWVRSWQTPFLLALSVAALAMKFTIKIV
jgi:hypothetical protein